MLTLPRKALRLLALTACAAALAAQPASAQERAADAKSPTAEAAAKQKLDLVLADLSNKLGAIRTLRCRFEQKKYLEVFEEVVTSEGTLALCVPDKLRWEYIKPLRSALTVNGRQAMRERTSRKGETTRTAFALEDEPVAAITAQQVFLWMRGDFAKAGESYALALVTEKPLVLRATPKDARVSDVVTSIDLTFSGDRTRLTGVALAEKGRARTEIAYLDVEIDPELPASLFAIQGAATRSAGGK